MPAWLEAYTLTVWLWGAMGGLLLAQLIVADIAGLRARHAPGTPIAPDSQSFLFRAARAHANTNESLSAFILISAFAIAMQANAALVNSAAGLYVGARVAHMVCYYADLSKLRSLSFGIALLALLLLLIVGVVG